MRILIHFRNFTPMQFINYNGKIIPSDTLITSANNRGLKYGDGLFETLRVINGHIPFADRHFKRLRNGMKVLSLKAPTGFNLGFFKSEIIQLTGKQNARVRLTVFRQDGGLYLPEQNKINFLIEAKPLEVNDFRFNPTGITLGLAKSIQLSYNQLSPLKTTNALPYILAAQERKKLKTDDILLLNQQGRIAEANSSNLFIWTGRTLKTPKVTECVIEGIIRSVLIDKVKQLKITVKEEQLSLTDLHKAKSIFLTNSIQGIRWVNQFENSKFASTIGSELTNLLNQQSEK